MSPEPTLSEEPSQSPSLSSEPTLSDEPSQSPSMSPEPTLSEEPSEGPSMSLEPSQGQSSSLPLFSLTQIICSPLNARYFSILCNIMEQIPNINEALERNRRKLQAENEEFTVFAPTDEAFERVKLPDWIDIEFTDDAEYEPDELTLLSFVIRNHVLASLPGVQTQDLENGLVLTFDDLECDEKYGTLNGEEIQIKCLKKTKFVVSSESPVFDQPKIISADNKAKNGILHVLNNVIVSDLSRFQPPTSAPSSSPTSAPTRGPTSAPSLSRYPTNDPSGAPFDGPNTGSF